MVAGAIGNIGSKLADLLLSQGQKTRVIVRSADKLQRFVSRGAEPALGSLQDPAFFTKAFIGADAGFATMPPNYTADDFQAYKETVGMSIVEAVKVARVPYSLTSSAMKRIWPKDTSCTFAPPVLWRTRSCLSP